MGLRDIIADLSPPWLSGYVVSRVMYVFGYFMDAIVEKEVEGARMHMPTRSDATALPYLGGDRRMPRGLYESDDAYAERLRLAFDTWRLAGSSRSVLSQLLAYVSPYGPRALAVHTVAGAGFGSSWDTYTAGQDMQSAPTHTRVDPFNWDWDSISNPGFEIRFWRVWYIVDGTGSGGAWATAENVWGVGTWGDGGVWGLTLAGGGGDGLGDSIRALVRQWKSAHSVCPWIIVSLGASLLFDPAAAFGSASLPDAKWGRWSKYTTDANGVRRCSASRSAGARYINGPKEVP